MKDDTFDVDGLARLLGLDTWQEMEDRSPDTFLDWGSAAVKVAREDAETDGKTLSDEEEDEIRSREESAARDEAYKRWECNLLNVAESVFEDHNLVLRQLKTKPHLYRVHPKHMWEGAAAKIVDTVNGVGLFHFSGAKELADSIPTTIRGAVLGHLHWMKRRSEVYGTPTPEHMMERLGRY